MKIDKTLAQLKRFLFYQLKIATKYNTINYLI